MRQLGRPPPICGSCIQQLSAQCTAIPFKVAMRQGFVSIPELPQGIPLTTSLKEWVTQHKILAGSEENFGGGKRSIQETSRQKACKAKILQS